MSRHSESTLRWPILQRPANNETWLADDARELRAVQRWRAEYLSQRCTRIEDYFERNPEVVGDASLALRLIYEEACLREEQGAQITLAEYTQRFPQWAEQLTMLWDCHELLAPGPARLAALPRVGDTLGDFRLVAEIDRGAAGRVFLAKQPSLSDRPMVLKITAHDGDEHLSLARLQHTGIMPLYFVQDDRQRHLRILCMPYLGGTSLARVLRQLEGRAPAERRGKDLCNALDASSRHQPAPGDEHGPARRLYERSSYVDAVCWIGACLADALQHAHARQLVHLDVKPSNILIAGDGQPMLLDFHLAQPMLPALQHATAPLGGTPGYMSPEQSQAMECMRAGRPLLQPVDARSDIYALGTVLFECLTGRIWEAASGAVPALCEENPSVTAGVEDVVRRCLERDPARRYPTAAALAEDLRRHMLNLPLQGVANRSSWERWTKWRRRRPYAIWTALMAGVLGIVLISVAFALGGRSSAARDALNQGRRLLSERNYQSARESLELGKGLIRFVPATARLHEDLDRELQIARSMRLLDHLHRAVDQLRFLDGLTTPDEPRLQMIADRCAAVWSLRQQFARAAREVGDPALQAEYRRDLTDLAVLWSDLRARLADGRVAERAHREAVEILQQAEEMLGSNITLAREHLLHQAALERHTPIPWSAEPAPREEPWELFAFGRLLIREGQYEQAQPYLERAVQLDPSVFWFHYYLGTCAYRQRQYESAVTALSVCVALDPDRPECLESRALAYRALGDLSAAGRDRATARRLRAAHR